MKKNEFVLKRLETGFGINCIILEQGKEVYCSPKLKDIKNYERELTLVSMDAEDREGPQLLTVSNNIYAWLYKIQNKVYIFGLIASENMTENEVREIAFHWKIKREALVVPRLEFQMILSVIALSYFSFSGIMCSESDIYRSNNMYHKWVWDEIYDYMQGDDQWQKQWDENGKIWYQHVISGIDLYEPENIKYLQARTNLIQHGRNNYDQKEWEYFLISMIASATHGLIEGGVKEDEVKKTAKYLKNKLRQVKQKNEYEALLIDIDCAFTFLMQKEQGRPKQTQLVKICKDYVSTHLFEKISVCEMANELGFHRSYLSRKFSAEAGESLQHYIIEQKLQKGEEMLVQSTKSVSQIAESLHFSSVSRFDEQFRYKNEMTPVEFRKLQRGILKESIL